MNHPVSETTRRYLNRYALILRELTAGMEGAELTDSISHNFIVQMIPHHRAAVEMARNVLKYIQSPALRSIAKGIISGQTRSIAALEAALPDCSQLQNTSDERARYQARNDAIMAEMFQQMQNAPKTNRIAEDFLLEMIPHHEGAIEMAENALQYPICDRLKPLLESIVSDQRQGVQQMRALLALGQTHDRI